MGTKRVCAMRSFCLALLLALVASVPIEQTHSVMETLPAKKFMIQVGNDLQNSELEESEPDQAVRGGWDLEQYRIKQTIKGNFGAISGPLACTSVCRVWTPKRTGALRPRRACCWGESELWRCSGGAASTKKTKWEQLRHRGLGFTVHHVLYFERISLCQ